MKPHFSPRLRRAAVLFILLLTALPAAFLSGCRRKAVLETSPETALETSPETAPDVVSQTVRIAELYRDIYETASREGSLSAVRTAASIADRLAENGYCVTDAENQNLINLRNPDLLRSFCDSVAEGADAMTSFFCISPNGGLIRFDLISRSGAVSVTRSVLTWSSGEPAVTWQGSYPAEGWKSDGDYLFFEENLPVAYDGAPGYTAVRIRQLEDSCLRWTEECLRPAGYGSTGLFFENWTEEDMDPPFFYDLFPLLYPSVFGRQIPYEQTAYGALYRVPEVEFETVIRTYFSISEDALRQTDGYRADLRCYEYRSRSFADNPGSPNSPYPEAISCAENGDDTMTLTVRAVWPSRHSCDAFFHEVTIRPMPDGGFQFVSNRVLSEEIPE